MLIQHFHVTSHFAPTWHVDYPTGDLTQKEFIKSVNRAPSLPRRAGPGQCWPRSNLSTPSSQRRMGVCLPRQPDRTVSRQWWVQRSWLLPEIEMQSFPQRMWIFSSVHVLPRNTETASFDSHTPIPGTTRHKHHANPKVFLKQLNPILDKHAMIIL